MLLGHKPQGKGEWGDPLAVHGRHLGRRGAGLGRAGAGLVERSGHAGWRDWAAARWMGERVVW